MVAIAISEYRDLEDKYNVLVQENAWYGNNNKALSDKVDKYDKQIDILKSNLKAINRRFTTLFFLFHQKSSIKIFTPQQKCL